MKTITVEYTFAGDRTATVTIPADLTCAEKTVLKNLVEQVQSQVQQVGATAVKVQFVA